MLIPVAHVVSIVAAVAGVGRVDVHDCARPVITIDTVSPVEVFNDDGSQSLVDGLQTFAKRFEWADQAIAMTAICDAGLKARIVQFTAPTGHDQVVESMGALNVG